MPRAGEKKRKTNLKRTGAQRAREDRSGPMTKELRRRDDIDKQTTTNNYKQQQNK